MAVGSSFSWQQKRWPRSSSTLSQSARFTTLSGQAHEGSLTTTCTTSTCRLMASICAIRAALHREQRNCILLLLLPPPIYRELHSFISWLYIQYTYLYSVLYYYYSTIASCYVWMQEEEGGWIIYENMNDRSLLSPKPKWLLREIKTSNQLPFSLFLLLFSVCKNKRRNDAAAAAAGCCCCCSSRCSVGQVMTEVKQQLRGKEPNKIGGKGQRLPHSLLLVSTLDRHGLGVSERHHRCRRNVLFMSTAEREIEEVERRKGQKELTRRRNERRRRKKRERVRKTCSSSSWFIVIACWASLGSRSRHYCRRNARARGWIDK